MAEVQGLRKQISNGGSTSSRPWAKVEEHDHDGMKSPRLATPPPRPEKTTPGGTPVPPGTPPGGFLPAPPRELPESPPFFRGMDYEMTAVSAPCKTA